MDVSPQLLREVEFREQWRGYNPDEVDDFLERLAVALGQLQEQLSAAAERAERAERQLLEASGGDELRRTLVLAQRTADAALEEARQRAAEVLSDADAQASATQRAADDRALAVVADAEGRVASELAPLLAQRDALEADVGALRAWAAEIRTRMAEELRQQLAWLEGSEAELPDPPDVVAIELPGHTLGHDGEGGGDDAGWDEDDDLAGAVAPPTEGTGGRGVADPDATGVYDALAERDDEDRYGEDDGALAAAAADDPFLTELRRAVTDDTPLGPRERTVHQADEDQTDVGGHSPGELTPSSVFRRRKRR